MTEPFRSPYGDEFQGVTEEQLKDLKTPVGEEVRWKPVQQAKYVLSDKMGWTLVGIGVIIGLVLGFILGLAGSQYEDVDLDRLHSSVGIEQPITNRQVEGSSPSGVSTP